MTLVDILDEEVIDLEVEGTTKNEILENLSKRLFAANYIDDVKQFIKDIYVREAEGPTGMGNHISIPHGKSKAVKKIGIAIGRTKEFVKWESSMSEDGYQESNMVFLFCVGDDVDFPANHMMLLAELAGKLGNSYRLEKLHEAKSKQELIEIILKEPKKNDLCEEIQEEIYLDIDIL